MLSEYKGAANSPEMFQYLVGETITGMFQDGAHLVLVLGSGAGLVLTSLGGEVPPAMWKEREVEVQARIAKRKNDIEYRLAELERITAIQITHSLCSGLGLEPLPPRLNKQSE